MRSFLVSANFNKSDNRNGFSSIRFVRTVEEFKQNLASRFSADAWLGAIDFSKWMLVGGCVLNALCQSPFSDTNQQDVNLVYCVNDIVDFKKSIEIIVNDLDKMASQGLQKEIKLEKIPGTSSYNVFLPCHVRLNFTWTSIGNSKNPLSHILHNFDMDICQVAFSGKSISFNDFFITYASFVGHKIVSTFPFLQAIATKSFIVYSLHAQSPKHLCTRIAKYCNRGFSLLEPIDFDGDCDFLMAQEEIPLHRIEHQQYIDDDGETRTATREICRGFLENIDTFRLQDKFMRMVCPQLLQYK